MSHLRYLKEARWCLVLATMIAIVIWLAREQLFVPRSSKAQLVLARAAAGRGDWNAALRIARATANRSPGESDAWMLVAQFSLQRRNYLEAAAAWERVSPDSPSAVNARLLAAETSLHQLQQLSRAERLYRQASTLARDNSAAVDGLAQILAISGRWRELASCLVRLIQLDAYSNFHLDLLVRGKELNVDPQLLPPFDRTARDDLAARCAHARLTLQTGNESRARSELESILRFDERHVPAQLLMGQVLLRLGDVDEDLQCWLHSASQEVREDPDYWSVALSAVQRLRDEDGALRCAWELLLRDPNDIAACLVLGRGLSQSGERELAVGLLERAKQLERYAAVVSRARRPKDWEAMRQAVELSEDLGLFWESVGWCQLAARLNPELDWPRSMLVRLKAQVAKLDLVRTDPAYNLALRVDPQRFVAPIFDRVAPKSPSATDGESHSLLAFREEASRTGLRFAYHNGGDWQRGGLQRMYEFAGAGVGVVDFDRDGYPDLFFPEGGEFAQRGQPMSTTDRLWQNWESESWRDVTEAACLDDKSFGQGICVGDFDNDGFSDLLVLNIGANVLWHSHGDGTFERSREFANVAGDSWSLSAAMADLDADSQPDIYVANYLTGDDVFTRVCPDRHGVPRLTCLPLVFAAAPDQFLRGVGDGRFEDRTTECGIDKPEGRGMGLIVGRLTQPAGLDVYVANDATANFHFVRETSSNSSAIALRFSDEAFVRGTAVDAVGKAQASMGIAVNDSDGDGRLDLFVTNFEGEINTLYLQESEGVFSDRSREFGLAAPSRSLLGFGTQFFDADLDGFPELVVANGHVNDRRDSGSLFQMRPQLFRNLAGRGFREVPPQEAGSYFAGEYLGRGLAVLDWNRDGRPDVVVSHLDRPAVLLTNDSDRRGRWLQVHCVGTASARDAIGTTVSLSIGDRRIVRQLTAGDGYASCNQRIIFMGLGNTTSSTVTLNVQWPSGLSTQLTDVPIDREVVVIEGSSKAWPLPLIGR